MAQSKYYPCATYKKDPITTGNLLVLKEHKICVAKVIKKALQEAADRLREEEPFTTI